MYFFTSVSVLGGNGEKDGKDIRTENKRIQA